MVDDVPADKMRDAVFITPVALPVFTCCKCPFLRERDVPDWGIDPDIDYEIIPARELYSPFQCPGDAPVMEVIFYPPDRVVASIACSPQGIKVREQEILEFRKLKEIMFLFRKLKEIMFLVPELGFCAADLADRILNFTGFQVLATTLVAFITPRLCPAVRADPLDIPVR